MRDNVSQIASKGFQGPALLSTRHHQEFRVNHHRGLELTTSVGSLESSAKAAE
jgi:hypothetical protein